MGMKDGVVRRSGRPHRFRVFESGSTHHVPPSWGSLHWGQTFRFIQHTEANRELEQFSIVAN